MVNYPFKSFDRHFDYGFGGYADAFKHAADNLALQEENGDKFLNMHLPINYLYRHAIELYLKSLIIILHRRLQLPFGTHDSESSPHILVNQKWIPVFRVHNINDLYQYFKTILNEQKSAMAEITASDWAVLPSEIDSQIATIASFDEKSTFLRYPDMKNREDEQRKSSFQEGTIPELFQRMAPGNEYSKAFVSVDENDNVAEVYQLNDYPLSDLTEALKNVASLFEGAHLGMRVEFANGE
jgi:hypothetical protein